ncbi:hypothetical protein RRG08_039257 [Elysia crispata]|uniref:Uncharacterized protein n=1 Tax=Elysia crispata TaxID=231223 RepID=A0AAE0ZPR1_9GAST|nr:hypothetical protein RRG08_039257 [Elysia crispata]
MESGGQTAVSDPQYPPPLKGKVQYNIKDKEIEIKIELRTASFIVLPKQILNECSDYETINLTCRTLKPLLTTIIRGIPTKLDHRE